MIGTMSAMGIVDLTIMRMMLRDRADGLFGFGKFGNWALGYDGHLVMKRNWASFLALF